MDLAGRNKILSRRRGRKPEEGRFKNTLEEENGAKKTANSNRQDQDISITPLGITAYSSTTKLENRHDQLYLIAIV
jgi:hypothetical protein